jgi:nitroreductase
MLKRIKKRLSRIHQRVAVRLRPLAARRPFLASLYFVVFDRGFRREQQAALQGQLAFAKNLVEPCSSSSLLRRSIHRIEKGLISRPRRVPFAVDYVGATVDVYARAAARANVLNAPEMAWAYDVLSAYFELHADQPEVQEASTRFRALAAPKEVQPPNRAAARKPYARGEQKSGVTFDDFLKLCELRRSVRWFQKRAVPRELLLRAMQAARQSPSACNRQPFRFLAFDQEPLRTETADLPPGVAGFQHNFPVVIAVVGRMRYYQEYRDRHLIYVDASLATMSFVLALETLGLSSCCINWPDIEECEVRAAATMKLAADERPIMFVAVGYADPSGEVPYSEKVPADDLIVFNLEDRS